MHVGKDQRVVDGRIHTLFLSAVMLRIDEI
jgi:hypothetical protein